MTVDDMLADVELAPACPECGDRMRWHERRSDGRPFLSCTAFPECEGAFSIRQLERMIEKSRTAAKLLIARAKSARKRGVTAATRRAPS